MIPFRKYIIGAIIGVMVGLWMGVNIGENRPLWSNPFVKKNIAEKAKDAASDVWKDAKKAARDKLDD